jgi:hypothetical protein
MLTESLTLLCPVSQAKIRGQTGLVLTEMESHSCPFCSRWRNGELSFDPLAISVFPKYLAPTSL